MEPTTPIVPQSNQENQGFFKELFKFAFIALIIVLPIRYFVAQPFIVSGESMISTFQNNDYLIVDEISQKIRPIARGDVLIFHPPVAETKYYIKRVIGLPGETVELRGSTITIKNATNPDGFTLVEPYVDPANAATNNLTFHLTNSQYFMMGDNRAGSYDSRAWGPLEAKEIIGRPIVRLFPLSAISVFPGESPQK